MSLRNRVCGALSVLVLLLGTGLASPLAAQSSSFGLAGGLGTEVIDGVTFQTLSILPDVPIGPVGLGIDMSFHFRFYTTDALGVQSEFGFYPRWEDFWDTSASVTFQENLSKWTSRLAYLRYGNKGDPINIVAGALPSVTLGNGFVVGSYSNAMLQPAQKFTGIVANFDGSLFQFPYVGLESFTDNLSSFDLIGLRVYAKPFGFLLPDVALLKDMQVGFTEVIDSNPYIYATTTGTGSVAVTGVDTSLTFFSNPVISAKAYGDFALQGSHVGGNVGIGGTLLSFISWGVQNRFLGADFLPDYFDKTYDLSRDAKYAIYSNTGTVKVPATLAWQASLGGNLFDTISFGAALGGPYGNAASATPTKYELPKLESYLSVAENPLLPITVDAYYNKDKLTGVGDLLSPKDAVIGARIGYKIGNTTITMVYSLKYLEGSTSATPWETTSKLETAIKLF
ncbi:MAG: hypothetical protein WCG80_02295 [Spirochaetales bacterium]